MNGSAGEGGKMVGGVGNGAYFQEAWKRNGVELDEKEVDVLETALLAEYDRLGGLIKRAGDVVKMGSFYDFKARKPLSKPNVVFTYRVNGEVVEVPDGEAEPVSVKAVKIQKGKAVKK